MPKHRIMAHSQAARGNDLYNTPPCAVQALLRAESIPQTVWEPAAGRGAIAHELRNAGHAVIASDLVQYDFPLHFVGDFLEQEQLPAGAECILTNPPFDRRILNRFVVHALDLCPRVILLLRLEFLTSLGRAELLENRGLARVLIFRNRLPMLHRDGWTGKKSTSQDQLCWFVWERGHRGPHTPQFLTAETGKPARRTKAPAPKKEIIAMAKKADNVMPLHTTETEIDSTTAALKIAPITVGNPAKAASLAIDQEHLEEYANPDAVSSIVECRRPVKGQFFTVRPEPEKPWKDRAFYFVLELEGRDPYIVAPTVAAAKKDEEDTIRPVMLVRYVTMAGEEGLWPLKLNPPDGKSNPWNTSALNILSLAEEGWIRIVSMKKQYRHQLSNKSLKETPPKFSDRVFIDLVNTAFKEDRIITSLDHEIWDDLANGSRK